MSEVQNNTVKQNKKDFYDTNRWKLAGNVVRTNGTYTTKKGKQFAFITVANHEADHTTFVEFIAWGKNAKEITGFPTGVKVMVRAHLGKGYVTTKHGDRVKTLVPVVNHIKKITFSKKSSNQSADKDSKQTKHVAEQKSTGKSAKKTKTVKA